jgi:hypothetical protein
MRKSTWDRPLALFLVVSVVFVQACSALPDVGNAVGDPSDLDLAGSSTATVEPLGQTEATQAADVTKAETPGASGLSVPNICQALPGEEVAGFAGGSLRSDPTVADYGDEFQGCTYELDTSDGGYDYYIVYAQPAEWLLPAFEGQGEPLPGLGDQAALKWEEGEQQYRLAVIKNGLGIEVIGENSDVMVQIARALLNQLNP